MKFFQPVVVLWEDTDVPFGQKTGAFNTTAWYAWIWGQVFCLFHPRGAVHVEVQ